MSSCGACGGGTSRITATGLLTELLLSYSTHCQLRGSSSSISAEAETCCSSTKTLRRIVIASLKVGGFVGGNGLEGVGRVRSCFGGGWRATVNDFGLGSTVILMCCAFEVKEGE